MPTPAMPRPPPRLFLDRLFATRHDVGHGLLLGAQGLCRCAVRGGRIRASMALVTGKTMMDRNAIPAVQDDAETGRARESEELYQTWHGKGRLRYAVTPRFADHLHGSAAESVGRIAQVLSAAR